MRVRNRAMATVLVAAAIAAMTSPAFGQMCEPTTPCGDVDESGGVTAGDALRVLKDAVGHDVALQCSCSGATGGGGGSLSESQQTMCWDPLDTSNPVNPIDCVGTGQDGELRPGLAVSFVDNGDGTVTEVETQLTWEKLSDDGSIHDFDGFAYQWSGAFGKIKELNKMNFAGHEDWRLPQVRELANLVDFASFDPAVGSAFNEDCAPGCVSTECSCTKSVLYWTSTTFQDAPTAAWTVGFKNGAVSTSTKTLLLYVRAVRGGA